MNRKHLVMALVAGTLATGAIGGLAYAKERGDTPTNEAAVMGNAKITMAQAIASSRGAKAPVVVESGPGNWSAPSARKPDKMSSPKRFQEAGHDPHAR